MTRHEIATPLHYALCQFENGNHKEVDCHCSDGQFTLGFAVEFATLFEIDSYLETVKSGFTKRVPAPAHEIERLKLLAFPQAKLLFECKGSPHFETIKKAFFAKYGVR